MSVSENDIVCRFVRSKDWSRAEQRPKPGAFKQIDFSVWHLDRLRADGAKIEHLQFDTLAYTGQTHYAAGNFVRIAEKLERKAERRGDTGNLGVMVEWAPDTVLEAWKRWARAHVEVRTKDCKKLLTSFRRALSLSARDVIPPATEVSDDAVSR